MIDMMDIVNRVHHKETWPFDGILIDRTTRWGNKYWMYCKSKDPTHDEKVDAYQLQIADMLERGAVSREEVAALHDQHLICHCRNDGLPAEQQKRCHGDVLLQVAHALKEQLESEGLVYDDGQIIIAEFKDYYRFLSNFYPLQKKIDWMGYQVSTVEHAYQMSKFIDSELIGKIANARTPADAKKLAHWNRKKVREDWIHSSLLTMEALLRIKFSDLRMMERLQNTKRIHLMEGNHWNDTFYGVDLRTMIGENHLGKLLMKIRDGEYEDDIPF